MMSILFIRVRGRGQPGVKIALAAAHFHSVGVALAGPWDTVEKVGAELKVTTNRAPQAPKGPKYGAFGARSGFEAGTEGVFQHAGAFSEVHIQLLCASRAGRPGLIDEPGS